MALTSGWYAKGLQNALKGLVDLDLALNLKVALLANTYVFAQDSHEFFDTSCNADEVTGINYVDGGEDITGAAVTVVDDAVVSVWVLSTSYEIGDLVRPVTPNGFVYRCVQAGTSSGTEPSPWTTVLGDTENDNTVIWDNVGTSFVKFDVDDTTWANSTITAQFCIFYVDGAAGSGDYLVAYLDFGGDEVSSAGDFDIIVPTDGLAQIGIS